ncbi:uncharacterized protein DNG_09073 [Cephalotrichum gorgonifer]|uniref:Uncharacterized protein n=1 Tax=Cephalotrichum gorgonifer TaxID=2041049 RepID=A0AAE8N680_9PEZI|nr:uncharacterized protein DNG_09073 [Cephalotrichum gorgonifer]
MSSISTIIPVALTILAATVQQTYALGCYNSGYGFDWLHGGKSDLTQEVINDIHTTCSMVAGKIIRPNEPFWHCTNWEKTIPDNVGCYESCTDGCAATPGRGGSNFLCTIGCDPNCEHAPEGGFNHIDWAIEIRDGQTEHEITYEQCSEAFNIERSGCQSGSEQNHHGFWFRIDPNSGACPNF